MKQLQIPPLAEGELYIGALGDKNGDLYHIVLLPGDNDRAAWKKQLAWAKSIGGDLPTRIEQAILYATFKDQFESATYWSNEADADESGWAWYQDFLDGYQGISNQSSALRARAVRRLPIR